LLAKKDIFKFNIVSMVNFLKNSNSNLLDFIGFEDITSEKESKKIPAFSKPVFEEHLDQ